MNMIEISTTIEKLEQQIKDARKEKKFDLVHDLYCQMLPLQDKLDAMKRKDEFDKSLQDIEDWYDDEKNVDAYNSRIVGMFCDQ